MALDGWKINVGTATSIVGNAQDDVDMLEGKEVALTTSFTEAATACDHIEIGGALDGLLSGFLGPLLAAGRNAGNSICGNTLATINAYNSADGIMAGDAEKAIYSVPTPPSAKQDAR
ncbi:DUF6507 family protein [Arthrobacter sp. JSM 101049]|uniref:DUF6507 family protein n=1 Tax=Arthrobacter sp. JSM 101049 TaxID=929097 RepID=UPI0035638122